LITSIIEPGTTFKTVLIVTYQFNNLLEYLPKIHNEANHACDRILDIYCGLNCLRRNSRDRELASGCKFSISDVLNVQDKFAKQYFGHGQSGEKFRSTLQNNSDAILKRVS